MDEVGIYRVSGVATDIQALKAAFDSSEFTLNLGNRDSCFRTNILDVKTNVRKESWEIDFHPAQYFFFFFFLKALVLLGIYWPMSHLSCRQQGRGSHDAGDGRKRHRGNTEAVFPWAAGASFHWWVVPKLCWRHWLVTTSCLTHPYSIFVGQEEIHLLFLSPEYSYVHLPYSSFWQCGQGELYGQPSAVPTGA